jgi:Flp pilus assembly protein TadG
MGKIEGFVRARKGAVLVEFAIAFMPICTMFLCVAEMSRYFIARMAVIHAAEVAVRSCAVISDPQPGNEAQLNGDPAKDWQTATDMVLKQTSSNPIPGWGGFVGSTSELNYTEPTCTNTTGDSNGSDDTVSLKATFTCNVPVAQNIVCSGGQKNINITTKFPHQGADYKL